MKQILIVIFAVSLSACASSRLPCEPSTCTTAEQLRQTRDPFPAAPITFGSIFGPQPEPGKISVD